MSDPVVEELLEKGARARAEFERGIPMEVYAGGNDEIERQSVAAILDAVLPGWREGITRELSARHGDQRFNAEASEYARYCARTCSACVLESRLVVHGPWVPVEEGTT